MKNQTEVSNKSIARHTPEPWYLSQQGNPDLKFPNIWVESDGLLKPAIACGITISEALANGNLIAASPELLESCKEMMSLLKLQEEYGRPVISGQVRERAKQAIDKAEGR